MDPSPCREAPHGLQRRREKPRLPLRSICPKAAGPKGSAPSPLADGRAAQCMRKQGGTVGVALTPERGGSFFIADWNKRKGVNGFMLKITLKDQSVMEVEKGTTCLQAAKQLSEGLARAALAAQINGETADLTTALTEDAS